VNDLAGKRVAIANRAEIAVRIATTCERLGMAPIVLLDEPDRASYAARRIGRVEVVGPSGSLFDVERVVEAAVRGDADMLHPGYGFLSERASLAEACASAGITCIGPSPETLRLCGDKIATREAAGSVAVPLLPATPPLDDEAESWKEAARSVGFPLIVKPASAGGGRGLRRVSNLDDLVPAILASRREASASGAGTDIYLERALRDPRHIEVQIAGDRSTVIALGDRDCSIQRRHQKVIEEAPAPGLADQLRNALHQHAVRIGEAVGLTGIATCEFLVSGDTIAFLEVNPRIQVEHPVTELVTGIDLVELQLRIAVGESIPFTDRPATQGHAIEARVYAEDPGADFLPTQGTLTVVDWPHQPNVRVDAGYATGDTVTTDYDSMLGKIIAFGADRSQALGGLATALRQTIVAGVPTNLPWLLDAIANADFHAATATTLTAKRVQATKPDRRIAVVAAVAWTLGRRDTADAWSAAGPLRIIGLTSLSFHDDEWEERVLLTRAGNQWQLELDGERRVLHWLRDDAGVWTVTWGALTERVVITDKSNSIEVAGSGGRWIVRRGPRMSARSTARRVSNDGRVLAPLTGRVVTVGVAVGDRVARGQSLVTIEAMKMEITCDAPADGVVQSIHCQSGGFVETGAQLLIVTLDQDTDQSKSG
jgi:3-methylcrotonyl-CoA carboxylase alpha subunit